MKRYYFYAPSDERTRHKEIGLIRFRLKALYAEDAYDQRLGSRVTSFKYFDEIDVSVNTRQKGIYDFKFDTGVDGCTGELATNFKELKERMQSFLQVTEDQYFRLRTTALGLMFRYTDVFNFCPNGKSRYYYANRDKGSFYDLKLPAFNYQFNRSGDDVEFLKWMKGSRLKKYDVTDQEVIQIFIYKAKPGEEPYQTSKFSISANSGYGRHPSFKQAYKRTFYKEDFSSVTLPQYERLRKFVKKLIFDATDLDISKIKKEQTYGVTILDI